MATLDELVAELETLSADSLEELSRFVQYLKWTEVPAPRTGISKQWVFDFVENFRRAVVSAEHAPAGMEVQVAEAVCSGQERMALWQHPPVQGAGIVEYQVLIPAEVRNPRLTFATGIRDGSQLAAGNIVAFRIFVDEWRIWSDTQHARKWNQHEIAMPSVPGDVVRIQFVTDGLGNHQWAWAAWGEPRIVGEVVQSP